MYYWKILYKTLDKIIKNNIDSKRILIQMPDGLKKYTKDIVLYLQNKYPDKYFYIWADSLYGGCDIDKNITYFDLVIHIGHNFRKLNYSIRDNK